MSSLSEESGEPVGIRTRDLLIKSKDLQISVTLHFILI